VPGRNEPGHDDPFVLDAGPADELAAGDDDVVVGVDSDDQRITHGQASVLETGSVFRTPANEGWWGEIAGLRSPTAALQRRRGATRFDATTAALTRRNDRIPPQREESGMQGSPRPLPVRAAVAAALAALAFASTPAIAQLRVGVTNLVTDDQAANAAKLTDTGLVNAWGVSYPATGPFWVSSNGGGTALLYSVNPATQATTKLGITVTIPDAGSVTGQVFNAAGAASFNGDNFLFVSEDGTISGWRNALGTTAERLRTGSPANVYKGAAFATLSGTGYLYAANFSAGTIDVLKGQTSAPDLTGRFTDPNLPAGYAPFNIQNLGGTMYVSYALQNATKDEELKGPGRGFVSAFDLQGNFIGRIASAGLLDAPWGLAFAPSSFGALAGSLLVGNFGDGRINVFNPSTHAFLGQLAATDGTPLAIDGLWALTPGNDGSAGSSNLIYFTAGPDDESHGLFGVLTPEAIAAVPEPSTALLLLSGLVGIGFLVGRRGTAKKDGWTRG
jgi:uncharacterized protein (TIGR03118 family)